MRRRTGGKFIEDLQARLPTVPSTFADLIMLAELSGRRRPPTARRRPWPATLPQTNNSQCA
jgi:hypothetical protein